MTPRTRNTVALVLILVLFAAPLVAALVLHAVGWEPPPSKNSGTLVEPPEDLTHARFVLANGTPLAWKDAQWSWTLFAVPGPDCAQHCLDRLDELRRARLTLNRNAYRLRVVVLDAALPADALARLAPLERGTDPDGVFAALRPAARDDVAAAVVDPHGFLVLRYPAGYDGRGISKDLQRLMK